MIRLSWFVTASAPKRTVLLTHRHALSPIDFGKGGDDSSSLGLKTSPKRNRTCSPRKEKIEALKGWDTIPSVSRARNFSGSKSKLNSATSLSRTKRKSSNVARSKN